MTPDTVVEIGQQALKIMVLLAAPMMLSVLVVGLLIGMVQAATQINEMTLSFIPKLIILVVVLVVAGNWMLRLIMDFTQQLFQQIPTLIG